MKYTFPMAASTTMLAWGLIDFQVFIFHLAIKVLFINQIAFTFLSICYFVLMIKSHINDTYNLYKLFLRGSFVYLGRYVVPKTRKVSPDL